MDDPGGVESGGRGGEVVALEFPAADGTPSKVPVRIRRRMEGRRISPQRSAEKIETKLREADMRRQQFHEWLSSKARPKARSPSWSSHEEDLCQRLEAKLSAAEQKRSTLLANAQMRLARLDELRQAAKTGVEMRFEKERERLGMKVEYRVQQAEEKRMHLFMDRMQRRVAAKERTARSLSQRVNREKNYRESVLSAIYQKTAAAENKRTGLLEAEKRRAQARVMQARRVAKFVCSQRENERKRLKEELEIRLQRAKQQRAEYLKNRGMSQCVLRFNRTVHGEYLSRKLARCWRQFVMSKRTMLTLAKAYETVGINESSVKAMPFEHLALLMESDMTCQTVKAFLGRLESRFLLSQSRNSSVPENVDHLLKFLAPRNRKRPLGKAARKEGTTKKGPGSSESKKPCRYPERVVLCAYMILSHPTAVFSEKGEREEALTESAEVFVRELDLLVKIVLEGSGSDHSSRLSSPIVVSHDENQSQGCIVQKATFRSQLEAYDKAWRSYLYCFVAWKVKDARCLEEGLVRAACQLELSMMQTCKLAYEGQKLYFNQDMKAIQKQVTEDQQLLRERIQRLTGLMGIKRLDSALSDTRSKFFEAQENGSASMRCIAHIASPEVYETSSHFGSILENYPVAKGMKSNHLERSLFGGSSHLPTSVDIKAQTNSHSSDTRDVRKNDELLVNEIIHSVSGLFSSTNYNDPEHGGTIKVKIKETLEKAFWDEVVDSLKDEKPNYSRFVQLVREVRDELYEMAPQSRKQEIFANIDLDIVTQVLESGNHDLDYLGRVLEYALFILQKLSAPANEDEMRKAHATLLTELSLIAQTEEKNNESSVIAVVNGLRFVLEQIQILKREISKAIVRGPEGLKYLRRAFADCYGPPPGASNSLPLTTEWISTLLNSIEEWKEHNESLSAMSMNHGIPAVSTLRSGGDVLLKAKAKDHTGSPHSSSGTESQPACTGDKIDITVRLGLLKLVNQVEGLTEERVPETLKLNLLRLRIVQSRIQQILVVATSMLVLRQILAAESSVLSPSDVGRMISDSADTLYQFLDKSPDAGIEDITGTVVVSFIGARLEERRGMMSRLLAKSLQQDDPVFKRVSRAVYLAARGVVLGGSGVHGRSLAEAVLQRIGATMLLEKLVSTIEVLMVVAKVSIHVHRPWYSALI